MSRYILERRYLRAISLSGLTQPAVAYSPERNDIKTISKGKHFNYSIDSAYKYKSKTEAISKAIELNKISYQRDQWFVIEVDDNGNRVGVVSNLDTEKESLKIDLKNKYIKISKLEAEIADIKNRLITLGE